MLFEGAPERDGSGERVVVALDEGLSNDAVRAAVALAVSIVEPEGEAAALEDDVAAAADADTSAETVVATVDVSVASSDAVISIDALSLGDALEAKDGEKAADAETTLADCAAVLDTEGESEYVASVDAVPAVVELVARDGVDGGEGETTLLAVFFKLGDSATLGVAAGVVEMENDALALIVDDADVESEIRLLALLRGEDEKVETRESEDTIDADAVCVDVVMGVDEVSPVELPRRVAEVTGDALDSGDGVALEDGEERAEGDGEDVTVDVTLDIVLDEPVDEGVADPVDDCVPVLDAVTVAVDVALAVFTADGVADDVVVKKGDVDKLV